ncbi:MAG: Pycsar system effector family protein [Ginsengibacter sp.]|jgi:predicted metal-dependent HD superfamily phosphohydrolase
MDYHKIDKRIEDYVTGLFNQMHSPKLIYHNLDHTKAVVKHTQEIAGHYNVSEGEMLILFASAWFHDTGYLFTEPEKHEEMSVEVMRKFMNDIIENQDTIDQIAGCIMATKAPYNPRNLLQQIICDGDTYHLGTKNFKSTNKAIYEELKLRCPDVAPIDFLSQCIKFLKGHQFYTNYCKELLNKGKEKNIKNLEKKVKIKSRNQAVKKKKMIRKESGVPAFSEMNKDKSGLMSKGIQTMLRLTSQNHLKLSDMADSKANILISVNAIIISVILGVLLRKLSEETYLIIPTVIFLLVAVTTIVISILATRPKISEGNFTMDDVRGRKTNLLFFGNFYKATYEQYDLAMRELMMDTDYLYGTLVKDIYFLGIVLGRKYKLIRLAYNIFMVGIIISVLAFGIATFFSDSSTSGTIINGTGSPFK